MAIGENFPERMRSDETTDAISVFNEADWVNGITAIR